MANQINYGKFVVGGVLRFIESEFSTWLVMDPEYLYTDSGGTTPVDTPPEPVGLIEDVTD